MNTEHVIGTLATQLTLKGSTKGQFNLFQDTSWQLTAKNFNSLENKWTENPEETWEKRGRNVQIPAVKGHTRREEGDETTRRKRKKTKNWEDTCVSVAPLFPRTRRLLLLGRDPETEIRPYWSFSTPIFFGKVPPATCRTSWDDIPRNIAFVPSSRAQFFKKISNLSRV